MNRFKSGDIVKHFKRELLTDTSDINMYLYIVLGKAIDTVTDKPVVIYKALYGDGNTYVRPVDEFESEVDSIKYPNIKQKYRFEKINRGLKI